MFAQFLLNLFIATLWLLLKDEPTAQFSTFFAGFLIGIFIYTFCIDFLVRSFIYDVCGKCFN